MCRRKTIKDWQKENQEQANEIQELREENKRLKQCLPDGASEDGSQDNRCVSV